MIAPDRATGLRLILDAFHAIGELALARCQLRHWSPERALPSQSASELHSPRHELISRVAYIIPRMAARVPWKSDCLVQAIAAQNWLERHGIHSSIVLGVPKQPQEQFEAHAWLRVGRSTIIGGDPSSYIEFE